MQRVHVAFYCISKFHFNYMVLVAMSTSTRTKCVSFLQVVLIRTNLSVSCFTRRTDLHVSSSRIKVPLGYSGVLTKDIRTVSCFVFALDTTALMQQKSCVSS